MRQHVREDVFRHERAEDAARVGERVVAAQRGVEQRLDAGPRRLQPAERAQRGKNLTEERRLAEREIGVRAPRHGVGGIGR